MDVEQSGCLDGLMRLFMGVVLIIVGIMLIGGIFERIAASSQFFWINFGL